MSSNGASGAQGRVRPAVHQHGHRKGQAPAESGDALQPWQTEEEEDQGETCPYFKNAALVHRLVRWLRPLKLCFSSRADDATVVGFLKVYVYGPLISRSCYVIAMEALSLNSIPLLTLSHTRRCKPMSSFTRKGDERDFIALIPSKHRAGLSTGGYRGAPKYGT